MYILCTPRPIYWWTYRPALDRCIGQHIGRVSTDICRSTYRPIYQPRYRPRDGRHIDSQSAHIAVNKAADTRPIRWPLIVSGVSGDCGWDIGRLSYNISQKLKRSLGRCNPIISHFESMRSKQLNSGEMKFGTLLCRAVARKKLWLRQCPWLNYFPRYI